MEAEEPTSRIELDKPIDTSTDIATSTVNETDSRDIPTEKKESECLPSSGDDAQGDEDSAGDADDGDVGDELEPKIPDGYRMIFLGVHRVIYSPPPPFSLAMFPGLDIIERAKGLAKTMPSVGWFLREIYSVSPTLSATSLVLDLIKALIPTASLYFNNRMLNLIETGLKSNNVDARAIAMALAARSMVSLVSTLLWTMNGKIERRLKSRIQLHFRYLRLKADLAKIRDSLPDGGDDADDDESRTSLDVYRTANQLIEFGSTAMAAVSESMLMYQMLSGVSGSRLGPMMFLMWAVRATPAFDSDTNRFWSQGYMYHTVNKDFNRLSTVKSMSKSSSYRQEILGLNLGQWIIQEFEKCRDKLRGLDLSSPYSLIWDMDSPVRATISDICDEWPTLYYAFSAIFGWASFSFATISSVQGQSWSLRWKFSKLFGQDDDSFPEILTKIHEYVEAIQIPPNPDDNAAPYPCESTHEAGMALEFRDVTFAYSGSKAKKPAINNLSVKIEPGQLVVIVGANGSGKTSLVKLLTRMHEPSSGTLYIDGRPAQDFKRFDLREATSSLSQDHSLFSGLSIAEEVGLGRWREEDRRDLIEECLKLGGAHTLVAKLKAGSDTVLSPQHTKSYYNLPTGSSLRKFYDKLEKSSSISGGEQQRLVASRTFMRLNTGNVKLLIADEPSAAMDPAGEFELFNHLREARYGKTMIFITHRFGHLTKHADLILCMKDGQLVEQGTHTELVAKKGEYFGLYNVQAQAFAAEVETTGTLVEMTSEEAA